MTTLAFLLLELSPIVLFEIDFVPALLLKYPLKYFHGIWLNCKTVDNMLCTRMTSLASLLLVLSPFVIFDGECALLLCPLCNSNTLWNVFIILGRYVEQDETMCHVQELQLLLS